MFNYDKICSALSKSGKRWVFEDVNERDILHLKQKFNVSDLSASIALRRSSSVQECEEMFFPTIKELLPDPSVLPDSEHAFEFVYNALLDKRKMAVWGDYDVDGACSAALLIKYFSSIGIGMTPYIPDRFQEGYGPNQHGLQQLKNDGVSVVFVVDCGTTAFDPLEWAKSNGIDVIIIDHHRVGSSHPKCEAFINPKRMDCECSDSIKNLCAGGLVFLFLVGLNRYLRNSSYFEDIDEPNMMLLMDIVALSTVCDMVLIKGLNRAMVKQGLKVMRCRKNPGISALFDIARVKESPTFSHLGYALGPRINAGGRIGDSSLGVKLLSSKDYIEAMRFARQLNDLNQERQRIEKYVEQQASIQAIEQKDRPFIFAVGEGWHEGVMGIVAGRLKDAFYKPSLAITIIGDSAKGSARSIPGLDIGQLIHEAYEQRILSNGGGHFMAGGFRLEKKNLKSFETFAEQFFFTNRPTDTIPLINLDGAISLQTLRSGEFLQSIEIMEPFGVGYPIPKFLISDVRFEDVIQIGGGHFNVKIVQLDDKKHSAVCFRAVGNSIGEWLLNNKSELASCVVSVYVDKKMGLSKAHLVLEDVM
ncbi:single-stranded-DNA-specific exonuclease RecJ [Candidatus Hydrogenosomobacter endosymbioticus]|uniref:single-stranded-DNA-specific exonuclease RecJ n=1 Tax=Candidatus Hydrogenosomobacter endosymbioticus TaxID=2558174 RepID=UPI001EFFC5D4|nr:single-stranded-DNA-specific exonuclease RecJ [Candidatus Hydrogenosomobacter endosymbioticus]